MLDYPTWKSVRLDLPLVDLMLDGVGYRRARGGAYTLNEETKDKCRDALGTVFTWNGIINTVRRCFGI